MSSRVRSRREVPIDDSPVQKARDVEADKACCLTFLHYLGLSNLHANENFAIGKCVVRFYSRHIAGHAFIGSAATTRVKQEIPAPNHDISTPAPIHVDLMHHPLPRTIGLAMCRETLWKLKGVDPDWGSKTIALCFWHDPRCPVATMTPMYERGLSVT